MRWLLMWATMVVAMAQSPIPKGAVPKNEGSVGAGEGPAWSPKGELFFTGGGKISRRDAGGKMEVFRAAPNGANGLLFDQQGRLVACESQNRRITRTEADGSVTVLTGNYEGKKYNSPNDLTIDSKGRIYFTDPRYGSRAGMEVIESVYRIDAPGKVTRIIGEELERPNGILVSPGDEYLYVADNNNNKMGGARKLYRFRLKADGSVDLASRKLIFDWQDGRGPDGLKMDRRGNLFVAGGLTKPRPPYEPSEKFKGGVYVFSADGKQVDFVPVPVDEVTNCAFGGKDLKTLYVTAGGTLWSLPLIHPGRVAFSLP